MIHDLYFSPIDDPRRHPLGPPVRVRWLGTAGFSIEHDGFTLLIDPYLTRASLPKLLLTKLTSNRSLVPRFTPRADAILVGHTHFDHVLDVPAIAEFTGARVFGSRSAVSLCQAHGIAQDRLCDVASIPHARAEIGPFHVRFVPSAHSIFLFGSVPFAGDIDCRHSLPTRVNQFRCGSVLAFDIRVANRRIYHLGSAELVEGHTDGSAVDLLLLCAAGWRSTPHFVPRVTRALSPQKILLSHWDDFTRPLDQPLRNLPSVDLLRLRDLLYQASMNDVEVGALPLLGDLFI